MNKPQGTRVPYSSSFMAESHKQHFAGQVTEIETVLSQIRPTNVALRCGSRGAVRVTVSLNKLIPGMIPRRLAGRWGPRWPLPGRSEKISFWHVWLKTGVHWLWVDCNSIQRPWQCGGREGIDYRNWAPGRPSNGSKEDCASMRTAPWTGAADYNFSMSVSAKLCI